jgi:hypothetical protein
MILCRTSCVDPHKLRKRTTAVRMALHEEDDAVMDEGEDAEGEDEVEGVYEDFFEEDEDAELSDPTLCMYQIVCIFILHDT